MKSELLMIKRPIANQNDPEDMGDIFAKPITKVKHEDQSNLEK